MRNVCRSTSLLGSFLYTWAINHKTAPFAYFAEIHSFGQFEFSLQWYWMSEISNKMTSISKVASNISNKILWSFRLLNNVQWYNHFTEVCNAYSEYVSTANTFVWLPCKSAMNISFRKDMHMYACGNAYGNALTTSCRGGFGLHVFFYRLMNSIQTGTVWFNFLPATNRLKELLKSRYM